MQLFHCLYVYPLTVSISRKRNLFIRVELRKDDVDIRKPPPEVSCISYALEAIGRMDVLFIVIIEQAMHPREPGAVLQKWAHTQVAVGARVACYHDEIKVSLPAVMTTMHHLLFTFFHVDLQTKLEAPKPVSAMIFICFRVYATGLPFTAPSLFEMRK